MITAGLFKKIADEKVAGLVANETLFWEEMPLDDNGQPREGVWLVTRGGDIENTANGLNLRTTVDFYVAFRNKVQTENVHAQISAWIRNNLSICRLEGTASENPLITYDYYNVRLRSTTTPSNSGITTSGLTVKVASVRVIYDTKQV